MPAKLPESVATRDYFLTAAFAGGYGIKRFRIGCWHELCTTLDGYGGGLAAI
jgi:hypothetical protein